jgi:hypothetical protein
VQNLLYLQAKLQKLEAIQSELDDEVLRSDDLGSKRGGKFMGNLEFLAKPRECEKTRTETAEEIEKAIKTYQMPGDAS